MSTIALSQRDIQDAMSLIERLDLANIDIDKIKEALKPLFSGYKIKTIVIDPGIDLFRGIIYINKPKTKDCLSYPPVIHAKINRASRAGHQFFYSGIARTIPFFELNVSKGETIAISRWRTTKKILLNNIGYTDDNFKNLASNRRNFIIQDYNTSKTQDELSSIIQNYLANTFSQKVNNPDLYKLTIAIAEKHYSEEEVDPNVIFDGLIYPSIPSNANADNIVLRKEFVDNDRLKFKEVEWIKITNVDGLKISFDVLDWANSLDANFSIEWKGRLQQWDVNPDEGFYFQDYFGRRIGRNKYGDYIEPY